MSTNKEIRDKSVEALNTELSDAAKHMFTLRTQAVTEKLEDPSQIGKARKNVARIKTDLRRREIEAAKTSETSKK